MLINLFLFILCCGMLVGVHIGYAQANKTIEISEGDWEIIKDLEFLELLETLEDEDTEFFENYEFVKDVDKTGGQDEQ